MEPAEAINSVEVVLRDLIELTLSSELGDAWLEKCGATPERIEQWHERKAEETKRRDGTIQDGSILDYADFTDLGVIIRKHWSLFKPCLGDRRKFEVYVDRLEECRNPPMHSRLLVPFERSLVEGMAGEIRNAVTVYRGERESSDRHFPRIEYVQDSFGRSVGQSEMSSDKPVLRPGDSVMFDCSGWDPLGEALRWELYARPTLLDQSDGAHAQLQWTASEEDIGEITLIEASLVGSRSYHRHYQHDGEARFVFQVLPR